MHCLSTLVRHVAVVFGLCGVSSAAVAAEAVLVPYGASDYRFVIAGHGAVPGFESVSYDDSWFAVGNGGFGSIAPSQCPLNDVAYVKTEWPANTDLLVRKNFVLPADVGTVKIRVAIDNDVQVFVNGQDVSGGVQVHDYCPTQGSFEFAVNPSILSVGDNVVAVRASDRGVVTFFDMEIVGSN